MIRRCLPPVATVVLAVCTITAMAAPARHAPPPAPKVVPATVEGVAATWDAAKGTLTLGDPTTLRGPRAARTALAGARRLRVTTTPATVLIGEDEEGYRERLTPDDLGDELDGATEEILVEASGRLTVPAATARRARAKGRPVLAAARVVVHLPAADADDPWGDGSDGLPDEGPVDDGPVTDPDEPDPDFPG